MTAAPARRPSQPGAVQVGAVPLDRILFHPHNIRRDLGDLRGLTASIRAYGVIQPVIAERYGDRLRLRAGHRRVAAARLAGRTTIPAVIHPTPLNDEDWLKASIQENHQRRDLDRRERADAALALRAHGYTWRAIAATFDVSAETVRDWVARVGATDDGPTDNQDDHAGRREKVAQLTAEGRSAAQIADQLHITPRTVSRDRAAERAGHVTTTTRRGHFNPTHPQATAARATCTPAHRATRTTHGGTACGPCWEAAIRADATRTQDAP